MVFFVQIRYKKKVRRNIKFFFFVICFIKTLYFAICKFMRAIEGNGKILYKNKENKINAITLKKEKYSLNKYSGYYI